MSHCRDSVCAHVINFPSFVNQKKTLVGYSRAFTDSMSELCIFVSNCTRGFVLLNGTWQLCFHVCTMLIFRNWLSHVLQLASPKHSTERFMDCPEGLSDSTWGAEEVGLMVVVGGGLIAD